MQSVNSKAEELVSREEIEQLQIERLQTTLHRAYRNVAFYRSAFDSHKVEIEKVRTVADLQHLPFTTKDDLRRSYPYDMFAVPLRDIVRIHASSGTTGKPIVVGYTQNDIAHWSQLIARQLRMLGLTEHDVIQIAFNYGLFTGGLGFHYGAELLGASVIPVSAGGNAREQILIMRDYKTTALLAMPSYALALANELHAMEIHPEQLFLKIGIFGAEPWSETVRRQIEEKLHIKAYDTYGVSEVIGPGVASECLERNGLHISEDHFILEVVDPSSGAPRKPGEIGELVFTTITKEGFPLIRYRTGDLASLVEGSCACGREFRRMSRVQGRTDDLIIAQGKKFFPSQVQSQVLLVNWCLPEIGIVLDRHDGRDAVEVQAALSENTPFFDELGKIDELRNQIAQNIETTLGIVAKVTFVEATSLRRQNGTKGIKVTDNRQL